MKPNKGALVVLDKKFYDSLLAKDISYEQLKLVDHTLAGIQDANNLIINFHGSNKHNGKLVIDKKVYHPIDIIKASRSAVRDTDSSCFDIFSCFIGTGIQSSRKSTPLLEKEYKDKLLEVEYVILNGGNKITSMALNRAEISRTVRDGDDKCPPYIRVLRRMCHYPETIKFLYVVKEINPTTGKSETKLVTYKFSALKLIPPKQVTIEKIRAHLLSSMELFKNEFLSNADEGEKEQIESEIEKEIERLKEEVLSKDDHLIIYGNKTLFLEVFRGKLDRVGTYLESDHFDINFITEGMTPFYIASYHNDLEMVKFLLSKGADPNVGCKIDNVTPILIASVKGHIGVVELLLKEGVDANVACNNGITPLYRASQLGHTKIVELLLEEGVDANVACNNRTNPLFVASTNGHIGVVKLLLEKGVDPNVVNENGMTPLYMVTQAGYTKLVEILLKEGTDPHLVDEDRITSLYTVLQNGYTKIVELLLKAGADPHLADEDGITPLYVASSMGHLETVQYLLESGTDPNVVSKNGVTSLYIASQEGHTKIVELLLKKGANPNLADEGGLTPIVTAIFKKHTYVVKMLLPKVDLSVCIWKGKGVQELIEDQIQDKAEKRELLKVLCLRTTQTIPSTLPTSNSFSPLGSYENCNTV